MHYNCRCIFGLIVSPCVGPFAASLLVNLATTRDRVLGFFSLFIFGLGLSTILLFAAAFSGLATSLPKPGQWLTELKRHTGTVVFD